MTPELYIVDPLRSETAWLVPQLASRIMLFEKTVNKRQEAVAWTRRFLARMVIGDPFVLCLAVVQDEDIVAHGLAEIVEVDNEKTLFILQLEIDSGYSHMLDKIVLEADNWGRSMNCKTMRAETVFKEAVYTRLFKRHNWRLVSRCMEREIPDGTKKD